MDLFLNIFSFIRPFPQIQSALLGSQLRAYLTNLWVKYFISQSKSKNDLDKVVCRLVSAGVVRFVKQDFTVFTKLNLLFNI